MAVAEPRNRHFTRDEYYQMLDCGFFEGQRVELIEGEVIEMPPQKNPHALAVTRINYLLLTAFHAERFTVRVQMPMHLVDDTEPEPDLAVVEGSAWEQTAHPRTAVLVVEVSETTLRHDRVRKPSIYAKAGVTEYWIVNLLSRQLEVYRRPQMGGDAKWQYAESRVVAENESISPQVAPTAALPVAKMLP
jgi:Uma2 family endonuclease